MHVLIVTREFSSASLARHLRSGGGHDVRALVLAPAFRQILDGLIDKVPDLPTGLRWVGYEGLIVFDETGFGRLQDELRTQGYRVVGGSEQGERLETDRQFGQRVFADCGLRTLPSAHFSDPHRAIDFVRGHPAHWVLKQDDMGHSFCYVGHLPEGGDVVDLLESCAASPESAHSFDLQQRAFGVEIGVARYFNGRGWVGPIEMNLEHKRLYPCDLGPNTDEMGTLMWYDADEDNRLFREMLAPLAPFLRTAGFRGDIDVNCIVGEHGVFPVEVTARFGSPALQLQMEIHDSPWDEFLCALAEGSDYPLRWKQGYGIVVLMAVPPFPFRRPATVQRTCMEGVPIRFKRPLAPEDLASLHPEEVTVHYNGHGEEWRLCGDNGFGLHVSGLGATVEDARARVYGLIDQIVLPKAYYRCDIGQRFIDSDRERLEALGYPMPHSVPGHLP